MYHEFYAFGGRVFCLSAGEKWISSPVCEAFRVPPSPAAYTIEVEFRSELPVPPDNAPGNACQWRWQENGRLCLLRRYDSIYAAYAVRDGTLVKLYLSPAYRDKLSTRLILESAGLFDLLSDAGLLILHSAFLITSQGEGILFSGPSGVGKSTQAALWERFADAEVINGDRSLVNPASQTAHGIFYAGTSGICKQKSAPIRAIVFPVHASENRLSVPTRTEAFAWLLHQCAYYPWAEASANRMTELVAALAGNVPVYRYECRKDVSAVEMLSNALRRGDDGIHSR